MSEECWDHTKLHRRGCGIRARVRGRASTNKKRNFHWRDTKGGVTLLESAPQGQKSTQTQGWVMWSKWDHL
jgi:hypothetical protein